MMLSRRRWVDRLAPETALALAAAVALGLVCALAPLAQSLLLLMGLAAALATLLWPAWVFLLLPFAVPFGELRTLHLGGLPAGGVEALLAGVSGAWLLSGLARRAVTIPRAPLLMPLTVFLGALLLSMPGATALPAAVKEVVKWGEFLAAYILTLAFAGAARRRSSYLLALGTALLLAATLEALSGIAQSILRLGPPSYAILGGRLWRAFGEMGQPNPFGGYINLTLLPVLSGLVGWLLSGADRGTSPLRGKGSQSKTISPVSAPPSLVGKGDGGLGLFLGLGPVVALTISAAILGLALILSWSRGAWFGAAAGGVVVVVGWLVATLGWPAPGRAEAIRQRALSALWILSLAGLVLVLAGAANLIPASVTARIGTVGEYFGGFDVLTVEVTDANFAVVERVAHWYAAANMWADHLWSGVGAGNYAAAYPTYNVPRWTDPLGHAHNYYLNLGAETGLIGLLSYLLLMLAATRRAVHMALTYRDWPRRSLAIGVLGVLVAVAMHHLFDMLYVHSMGVHLAILLGLVDSTDSRAG